MASQLPDHHLGKNVAFVYFMLRAIRALCGFVALVNVAGLISALPSLGEAIEIDAGKTMALILLKLFIVGISVGGFMLMRYLVNLVHTKAAGSPHPSMAKAWNL